MSALSWTCNYIKLGKIAEQESLEFSLILENCWSIPTAMVKKELAQLNFKIKVLGQTEKGERTIFLQPFALL